MLTQLLLRSTRRPLRYLTPLTHPVPLLAARSTNLPTHRLASHTTNPNPPSPHTPTSITARITEIQDLYATARDEFEIASEETSKKTVYAADDRAAAQEELAKLKAAFEEAVREEGGEEVRRRVGGRVRELEVAVERMEEMARED